MSSPRLRLGQLLVDAKLISEQALNEVLEMQRADGRRLGTLLVERGLVNETQLTQILSHQLSVPWVSLLHIEFSRQLLNLVPYDVADRFCLVPIYVRHVRKQGETLYVAMDDPSNEDGLAACREHAGLPVRAMIAPPHDIRNAIRVYYGISRAVTDPAPPMAPATAAPAPVAEPAAPAPSPEPAAPAPPAAAAEAPPVVEPPSSRRRSALAARVDALLQSSVADEGPSIEATEIPVDRSRAEKLRALLGEAPVATDDEPAPPSGRVVENIPLPRGRAPRMVALTLLDGTTIPLPAKRRARPPEPPPEGGEAPPPRRSAPPVRSEPPGPEELQALTARDLVIALRAVAQGADASEVLGPNVRWESVTAALLSVLLKKHLIADWEFVEELKKTL